MLRGLPGLCRGFIGFYRGSVGCWGAVKGPILDCKTRGSEFTTGCGFYKGVRVLSQVNFDYLPGALY